MKKTGNFCAGILAAALAVFSTSCTIFHFPDGDYVMSEIKQR